MRRREGSCEKLYDGRKEGRKRRTQGLKKQGLSERNKEGAIKKTKEDRKEEKKSITKEEGKGRCMKGTKVGGRVS